MTTVFEIPLSPNNQKFLISLSNTVYSLTFKWNNDPELGGWFVDIADQNGSLLIGGVPLVTGDNLLTQYDYLEILGQLIVQTSHDTDAVPTFENLGINSHLFYLPTP